MRETQEIRVMQERDCEIATIVDEDGSVVGYTEVWFRPDRDEFDYPQFPPLAPPQSWLKSRH